MTNTITTDLLSYSLSANISYEVAYYSLHLKLVDHLLQY